MNPHQWSAVDQYITDLLVPPDPALELALKESEAAGLPPHQVSAAQGKLLMLLAQIMGACSILEIGTLGGYSAIWLARGMAPGGKLVSLEAQPRHAEIARANMAHAGLDGVVEVLVGPALDTLPLLEAEPRGPFDLTFIDADKAHNAEYLAWALRLSRPGSLIVADNVVRNGAIIDSTSDDPSVRGVRRFYEALAAEPRLIATAIQTVGDKGYDGFALALVNADD